MKMLRGYAVAAACLAAAIASASAFTTGGEFAVFVAIES
jgi:hypothetical protein